MTTGSLYLLWMTDAAGCVLESPRADHHLPHPSLQHYAVYKKTNTVKKKSMFGNFSFMGPSFREFSILEAIILQKLVKFNFLQTFPNLVTTKSSEFEHKP